MAGGLSELSRKAASTDRKGRCPAKSGGDLQLFSVFPIFAGATETEEILCPPNE